MEKVNADWIMVVDNEKWQGVKQRKQGQRVMRVSDLQRNVEELINEGLIHPEAHKFLFNDNLAVQQGIFKWNSKSESFRKVTDSH